MKYILMMTGTKADFAWYAKWPKKDLEAQFAFMHAFNKELKDSGTLVAAEGLERRFHRDNGDGLRFDEPGFDAARADDALDCGGKRRRGKQRGRDKSS
jgi:hypothetical protein